MKVALNLVGLPSIRQGGAGIYAGTLARGLATTDGVETIVLGGPVVVQDLADLHGRVALIRLEEYEAARPLKALQLAASWRTPQRYFDGHRPIPAWPLAECDIVHYPLNFMSGPSHDRPTVVTCNDLQHLDYPEFFAPIDRFLRAFRWPRALRTADRVLAISHYTKAKTVYYLGIDPDRIDVVPYACDERFFSREATSDPELGEYVFYPASPAPHKNHPRLLKAFARVAQKHPEARLVLCGPIMHDWKPVQAAARSAGVESRVVFLPNMGPDEMRVHYAHARGLIFPSLFEGFGLPVLEAMAAGCPLAATNTTSVPEIVHPEVCLFDPRNEDALADAIEYILTLHDAERDDAIEAGRRRAAEFRPARMVQRTLAVYAKARSERR